MYAVPVPSLTYALALNASSSVMSAIWTDFSFLPFLVQVERVHHSILARVASSGTLRHTA
jgi:hypothetical protein